MSGRAVMERIMFPQVTVSGVRLSSLFSGRTVLVTGGSRGIGAAIARAFGAAGAHVVLVARDEVRLAEVAASVRDSGGTATVIAADLRDDDELDGVLAHPALSEVSVLVNNAGLSIRRSLAASLDRHHDVRRTIAVNHLAPTRLVLALAPVLARRNGHIVNVSSAAVLLPPAPRWAAYQSSKAAFDQWLRSCAPELEAMGVRVHSLYFPLVRTEMLAGNARAQAAPAMSPEQAAVRVSRALVSGHRRWQPWWLGPAVLLASALRSPVEAVFRRTAFRRAVRR